jgi:hypothetical protein
MTINRTDNYPDVVTIINHIIALSKSHLTTRLLESVYLSQSLHCSYRNKPRRVGL